MRNIWLPPLEFSTPLAKQTFTCIIRVGPARDTHNHTHPQSHTHTHTPTITHPHTQTHTETQRGTHTHNVPVRLCLCACVCVYVCVCVCVCVCVVCLSGLSVCLSAFVFLAFFLLLLLQCCFIELASPRTASSCAFWFGTGAKSVGAVGMGLKS
jgi:hypothetical protein